MLDHHSYLHRQGIKAPPAGQGPSLGVFSRLPSLQSLHHTLEIHIMVSWNSSLNIFSSSGHRRSLHDGSRKLYPNQSQRKSDSGEH